MRTVTGETPVCATVSMKKENSGMFPMNGNQAALLGLNSQPVVQCLRVTVGVSDTSGAFQVDSIILDGTRPSTGYDIQGKSLQGNHTISDKAIRLYQQMMTFPQPLSDVLIFYENLTNELIVEYELLLSIGLGSTHPALVNRKKQFDAAVGMFQLAKISTESATDRNTVQQHLRSMILQYNEAFELSALSVDGLGPNGNQGEQAGLKHMDELNAIPFRPVDLLKLLRLLDFEALYAVSPSDYTTEAFLEYYAQRFPGKKPTMMGTPFNGSLLMQSEIVKTPQSFQKTNPVVTRLFLMAHNILGRKQTSAPLFESNPAAQYSFQIHDPHQTDVTAYESLTNITGDLRDMLLTSGNISPFLSRSIHYDITRQPFGYPFHTDKNQKEVCSNLATLAANTISESLYYETRGAVNNRRTTKSNVHTYLQGLMVSNPEVYREPISRIHQLLEQVKGDALVQEPKASYIERYQKIFQLICNLIPLDRYCNMVKG